MFSSSSIVANFEKTGTVKFDFNASLNPLTGEMIPIKDTNPSPYMVQTLQHLSKPDPHVRLAMAKYLLESEETNTLKLDHIWFTGHATFYLHGYGCRDVYRFWGSTRPEIATVTPLDDLSISVWTAICGKTILGPYFVATKFTPDDYHDFLAHQILHDIRSRDMDTMEYCWMQDVPDDLKTEKIFYLICARFGDQMLADRSNQICNYGIDWPSYSPDLNPIDFFLWGYVKDKLDEYRPTTQQSLEQSIGKAFRDLRENPDLLIKNLDVLKKRLDLVKKSAGWFFDKTFY